MEKQENSSAVNPQQEPSQEAAANDAAATPEKAASAETTDENPEAVVEEMVTEAEEAVEAKEEAIEDKEEVLESATYESLCASLEALSEKSPADYTGDDLRRIRQHFNMLLKADADAELAKWLEDGKEKEAFTPTANPVEDKFKALYETLREKKNQWSEEQQALKAANLAHKSAIIAEILALAEDTDNVNRTFPRYRELQDEFNAAGEVPATEETMLWKRFAEAREKYSDNLKINKELRDYDFKKNLESKQLLLAEAESLAALEDVIEAYRKLQELHDKWRQIGPVAKEIREEIWEKFKAFSSEINKRYQAHFEMRKAREQANEAGKTTICEKVEALDFSSLNTFSAWEEMTGKIKEAQTEWKTYGFASKKANNALFSRFREVCDRFFEAKAAYYRQVRESMDANLKARTAIVERAEALKDSTEWRKTGDEIINLQKEWKTIGPVQKKHSDALWKRFQTACDTFFDRRKKNGSGTRKIENDNLRAKRDIIEKLGTVTAEMPKDEVVGMLRDLQAEWNSIGHVPFREKDKIYDEYRAKLNGIREMFDFKESRARIERFNASIADESDNSKIAREHDRLARISEAKRLELRTLENNLCFLNSKSKSGDSLLREFNRKIEKLKQDIEEIDEKLNLLDAKSREE